MSTSVIVTKSGLSKGLFLVLFFRKPVDFFLPLWRLVVAVVCTARSGTGGKSIGGATAEIKVEIKEGDAGRDEYGERGRGVWFGLGSLLELGLWIG